MIRMIAMLLLLGVWPSCILLAPASVHAEPAYAKWGKYAMKATMKQYPDTQIVEYLHIGRKAVSPLVSEEHFKFLLKKDNSIRALYVRVRFYTKTEQLISILMEEPIGAIPSPGLPYP